MKKSLIFAAALALGFSAAQAQFIHEPEQITEQISWLTPQQVKVQAVEAPALDAPSMESLASEQPLRTYVNAGASVWYQKPKGTLSYTFTSSSSGSPKCAYIVAPMFLPLTFINKYATPEEATWINSSGTTLTADANFNYRTSYPKPTTSANAWYAPLITAETDTFRFGGSFVTANSRALVVGALDVRTTYTCDRNEGYYNGYTNYTYYGTNTNAANPTTTVKQYMEAPVAPMWVEDIWFHYCSKGDTLGALQNGATVTFTIYSLATPNSMTGATELFTTEISAENIDSQTANAAGTQTTGSMTIPVGKVIEGPYAIVLDGFNREGVNFGVYMAKLDNTADFYGRGGVYPTLVTRVSAETGEVLGDSYLYNATNGTQYNAVFALDMMWDVAYVNTNYLTVVAPAEGGAIHNPNNYLGVALKTSKEWTDSVTLEDNYTINGIPEWLEVTSVNTSNYATNSTNIIHFNAAPNYTGETRTATLRVVSAKGAKSQEVTVTQEAAEMPDVYILGEVGENTWAPNVGQKMTLDAETSLYTAEIECIDADQNGYDYFSFTTELAENNDQGGWDYIVPFRFGAVSEASETNPNGDFLVTDDMLGVDLSLTYDNGHAFRVPAGDYNLTLNYADMKLKIEKVAAPIKLGDANCDGKIDVNDVTAVINYILKKNPNPFSYDNANVNGDDKVDVMDVTLIIDMILHPNNY